jgi:hypothetical protein
MRNERRATTNNLRYWRNNVTQGCTHMCRGNKGTRIIHPHSVFATRHQQQRQCVFVKNCRCAWSGRSPANPSKSPGAGAPPSALFCCDQRCTELTPRRMGLQASQQFLMPHPCQLLSPQGTPCTWDTLPPHAQPLVYFETGHATSKVHGCTRNA